MRYPLHQITCQLAQLAALPFHQIDMGKQILVSHAVYHIDKPVGLTVQIGLVYLLNITGKHHFCTFAGRVMMVLISCGVRFWASSIIQ